MSAIYVMWLRQIKRYWRSKSRMIGALGQPLLFLFALGLGFGPIFEQAGAGNYIQFLAPGVIAMTIPLTAMFSGIEVIWERQIGFIKETLVAPIKRSHIMIGRTLGGATIAIFQGLIVFIFTLIAGFRPNFLSIPLALLFMFLIACLFTAIGIAFASKLEDMQAFPIIINFIIMPIFFLSGSIFPLNTAPKFLRTIAQFNPLTYGIDGIRGTLTGINHFSMLGDFLIIAALMLLAIIFGSHLFNKVEA